MVLFLGASGCSQLTGVCTDELRLSVEPAASTIHVGDNFLVRAGASTCGGKETVPIEVVWSSSDSTVIQVDPNGGVIGVGVGSAIAEGMDRGPAGVGLFTVPVEVLP